MTQTTMDAQVEERLRELAKWGAENGHVGWKEGEEKLYQYFYDIARLAFEDPSFTVEEFLRQWSLDRFKEMVLEMLAKRAQLSL